VETPSADRARPGYILAFGEREGVFSICHFIVCPESKKILVSLEWGVLPTQNPLLSQGKVEVQYTAHPLNLDREIYSTLTWPADSVITTQSILPFMDKELASNYDLEIGWIPLRQDPTVSLLDFQKCGTDGMTSS
jgi:hypothetical protein